MVMKVSVICVYNNSKQLEEQLLKSLKMQDLDYEFIPIDNSTNRFKSAATALNYGASISTGDVLVFSHQDIQLKTSDALSKFSNTIYNNPTGNIFGTQGVKEPSKTYYSNITFGTVFDKSHVNTYSFKLYAVSCVDEGFFGMKKETWQMLNFNELLCDNWHLYCVEICLHARKNGGHVYVAPIQLHHYSMGTISLGYMRNLKLLCCYYRHDFKYIWTTCYKVKTNAMYINVLYYAWRINRFIKSFLQG